MRRALGWLAVGSMLLAGCGENANVAPPTAPPAGAAGNAAPVGAAPVATDPAGSPSTVAGKEAAGKPSATTAVTVPLTPENTTITFVGTHAPPKEPKPRTGTFERFQGEAEVNTASRTLQKVTMEIETGSLKTEFPMLTSHLNSPDFFDTQQYPKARFESTKIVPGQNGEHTITGNLTLLETTKEISFPAKLNASGPAVVLTADFTIDRLDFGVGEDQQGVERPVKLSVVIGKPPGQ